MSAPRVFLPESGRIMRPSPSPHANANAPQHPDLDTWIAYREGTPSEEEERRLRDHLATCPRCTQLLLEMEAFINGNGEVPKVADFEKAAVWRLLKAARDSESSHRPRPRTWMSAVAAVLLAILGVGGLIHQQSELHELRGALLKPQANVPIVDLNPGSRLRSLSSPAQEVVVPADRGFTLILNLLESTADVSYGARVLDGDGEEVVTVKGLRIDDLGTLTVLMPAHLLAPGLHTLEVRGSGAPQDAAPLETFRINLRRPHAQD